MRADGSRPASPGRLWAHTPATFKVAALLGILAWFIGISGYSTTVVDGRMTACSYSDYAKIGLGAIVLVLAGWGLRASRRRRHRIPGWLAGVITVLLAADGVLLILRGMDLIATVCH